jgi:hypothetical protein
MHQLKRSGLLTGFADCRCDRWRVDGMTVDLNKPGPENQESPWVRVAQVVLLIAFAVAVYFIGLSMVHHRFFRGGRIDRFGHVRQ